jgi:predicted transport protein
MPLDGDMLELAEPKSISYHGPAFFLEVLPRRYTLTLLLALDFNEIDDPSGLAPGRYAVTVFCPCASGCGRRCGAVGSSTIGERAHARQDTAA